MGLSNEERIEGILYRVSDLVVWGKGVKDLDLKEFTDIIDNLWHNVFNKSFNNKDFWIFGGTSDFPNNIERSDPWSVIVRDHIESAIRENDDDNIQNHIIEEESKEFDPFSHFLDIEGLLMSGGSILEREDSSVFRLYQLCEAISYPLKRYNDNLYNYFSDLSKSLSDLLGCCFIYMKSRESFSKAYLVHQICEKIYGNMYTKDWVTKWLLGENVHHYIKHAMEWKLIDIIKVHVRLLDRVKAVKDDHTQLDLNRVLIAVRMSGRSMHYKHFQDKLIKECQENGITEKQINILKKEFIKCEQLKKDHESEIHEEYSRDSTYDVYGWTGDLSKIRENSNVVDDPNPVSACSEESEVFNKVENKES